MPNQDPIFQPFELRNLTVKNRIFRSGIHGRWDNYEGHEDMIDSAVSVFKSAPSQDPEEIAERFPQRRARGAFDPLSCARPAERIR